MDARHNLPILLTLIAGSQPLWIAGKRLPDLLPVGEALVGDQVGEAVGGADEILPVADDPNTVLLEEAARGGRVSRRERAGLLSW